MLRRRLLGALSLLSLILCGITVVLWVRSYQVAQVVRAGYWDWRPLPRYANRGYRTATHLTVLHDRGTLSVATLPSGCVDGPHMPHHKGPGEHGERLVCSHATRDEANEVTSLINRRGIHTLSGIHWGMWEDQLSLSLPDPLLALITLALPLSWLNRSRIRRRRIRRGQCPSCGYDCHATPGRCSECGWREAGRDAN
jgi:hypothetical protein